MKKLLLLSLIFLSFMTSCISKHYKPCNGDVILTSNGLTKKYIRAFKLFKEHKDQRYKCIKIIKEFLLKFKPKYRMGKKQLEKNPFYLHKNSIFALLGKPDKNNNNWMFDYEIPNSNKYLTIEFYSDGIVKDISYSHVIR